MILVYHGSLEVVESPMIRESNRTLDYGSGFYTTTSFEQAAEWVRRRVRERHAIKGYVSVFELDEDAKDQMNTLSFSEPSDEWIDFVQKNRTQKGFTHDYDIVYGPVANDRVYTQFALFESGVISRQTLIAELKTYKLVDQYLFHTQRSLGALRYVEAKEVML